MIMTIHNDQIQVLTDHGSQSEVITLEEQMIDLRP